MVWPIKVASPLQELSEMLVWRGHLDYGVSLNSYDFKFWLLFKAELAQMLSTPRHLLCRQVNRRYLLQKKIKKK